MLLATFTEFVVCLFIGGGGGGGGRWIGTAEFYQIPSSTSETRSSFPLAFFFFFFAFSFLTVIAFSKFVSYNYYYSARNVRHGTTCAVVYELNVK